MVKVIVSNTFSKDLFKLPKNSQRLVSRKLLILKEDPYIGKPLSGKLKGSYSVRIWPYRVLYQLNTKTKTVYIYKIQHRKDVYKN